MEALLAVWCRPDWKSAEEGNEIYFVSEYKQRLIQLRFLPVMYIYDLADIMFFIKSLNFLILNLIS